MPDPLDPQALFALLEAPVNALAAAVGVPTGPPDPLASTAPVLTVDDRITNAVNSGLSTLAGVDDYLAVAGTRTSMRNEALRQRAVATDARLDTLETVSATQQQLIAALASGATATSAQVVSLNARLDIVQALGQLTQSQLAANATADAADQLRLAAVEAKATLTASATTALQADLAKNTAADALVAARLTQDEAAITAAQATADAAKTAAAAAQLKANQDADAIAVLQQQLATAQATADAAKAAAATNTAALTAVWADLAKRLPTDAVRRQSVATAAVTLQVATPATVAVTFATPFPDAAYELSFSKPAGGLLGVELGWQNKTAAGFTLTLRNTGLATLAVPASTVDVFAIR